jgi:DNA-binding LacI/PurR family transcriptional regulator
MVGLAKVARQAGVSVATASRVANGIDRVKPSTRARVLKALEELGYYPDLHARSLVRGVSQTIGVIVSNLENPFFVDVIDAIEQAAIRNGYDLLISNTGYEPSRQLAAVRLMLGRRISGLAVITSETEPAILKPLERAGIPVVVTDTRVKVDRFTSIQFQYARAIGMLVDHLASLEHTRMAYIGLPIKLTATDTRRRTFLTAARRLSIDARCFNVRERDGFEGGRDAAREILASGFQPTAILCVNDITAIGVLRELRNQRIPVPAQISVTGFDNIGQAQFSSPSLTTIHIPRDRIGRLAFERLTSPQSAGKSGQAALEFLIEPELIVRESTGKARRFH